MDKEAILEAFQEAMATGEAAFSEKDYKSALEYFKQAKEIAPMNAYALSRAGAAAIALNDFDAAISYFQKACDVQPDNGDNAFNLGNAYFLHSDFNHALQHYSRAEILGCSKGVQARLFYQLSVMNMLQGNIPAAILNFQKFENSDESKRMLSDPKIIKEKLKLYMMARDFARSAECAVQLIQMAPQELRGYLIYFNLLNGVKKFDEAAKILDEAEQYANLGENGQLTIIMERITLYLMRASAEPDNAEKLRENALDLIHSHLGKAPVGSRIYNQMVLSYAEVEIMRKEYDEAGAAAFAILPELDAEDAIAIVEAIKVHRDLDPEAKNAEMDDAAFDDMLRNAMADLNEKINIGLISPNLIEQATVYYDSDNKQVREYPEGVFDAMEAEKTDEKTGKDVVDNLLFRPDSTKMRPEFYERARFLLITALISLEEYEYVKKQAAILRGSKNTMYAFFAMYAEALAQRKTGCDANDEIYNALLAFFRGRMLKKDHAPYAALYRARMYAELGKYAKADEMARLVPASEKASLAEYILTCKETVSV